MIEKILEKLTKFRDYHLEDNDKYNCGMYDAYDEAIEIVQEVAKEYGWIPVTDHLPNDDGLYNGYFLVIEKGFSIPWVHYFNGRLWYTDSECKIPTAVIAWQPLPAPYQKGE